VLAEDAGDRSGAVHDADAVSRGQALHPAGESAPAGPGPSRSVSPSRAVRRCRGHGSSVRVIPPGRPPISQVPGIIVSVRR
jgi:hypothetical protein